MTTGEHTVRHMDPGTCRILAGHQAPWMIDKPVLLQALLSDVDRLFVVDRPAVPLPTLEKSDQRIGTVPAPALVLVLVPGEEAVLERPSWVWPALGSRC